MEQHGKPVE